MCVSPYYASEVQLFKQNVCFTKDKQQWNKSWATSFKVDQDQSNRQKVSSQAKINQSKKKKEIRITRITRIANTEIEVNFYCPDLFTRKSRGSVTGWKRRGISSTRCHLTSIIFAPFVFLCSGCSQSRVSACSVPPNRRFQWHADSKYTYIIG